MDEDGLPIVGSGIDLTKVPAIQQKRTVAFLNQFVVHTVQFLNRFSTVCEECSRFLLHKCLRQNFSPRDPCKLLIVPHSVLFP
uniref:WASH complex subunit 3 n=1 Tax=Catharus ustulatus TaxID=91951 RepID=A0A8C3TU81_CATUS